MKGVCRIPQAQLTMKLQRMSAPWTTRQQQLLKIEVKARGDSKVQAPSSLNDGAIPVMTAWLPPQISGE
jgi:hypothetical protein